MQQLLDALLSNAGTPGVNAGGAGAQHATGTPDLQLNSLLNGKGGLLAGLAAGGLAGTLLGGKKTRKFAKGAVKVGGVALAGGLAYKAFQHWQNNKQATAAQPPVTPPAPIKPVEAERVPAAFLPASEEAQESLARTLMLAMITAARADGQIDEQEEVQIADRLKHLDLSDQDHNFLSDILSKPADMEAVVISATKPEIAAEIYTISLLVTDETIPAQKAYLDLLSARLGLDHDLREALHDQVERDTVLSG